MRHSTLLRTAWQAIKHWKATRLMACLAALCCFAAVPALADTTGTTVSGVYKYGSDVKGE